MDKFTIQDYWVNELGDLYNIWYNWFNHKEPARTIAQIISQFIPKKKSEIKIFDCACGTGNPSLALKRKGFNVLASDGSAKMLAKASENARQIGVNLKLYDKPVLWSNLAKVFSKKKFDVVVCTGNSICHVPPEGVHMAIEQMSQVLKPSGLCIIDIKRYNERIRELHYEKDRGWVERSVRIDKRCFPDGKAAQFVTRLSYEGEDIPGRIYNVELDLRYSDNEHQHYVFPVWAVTASIILECMEKAGMQVQPLYMTPNPSEWKYDFCIGQKEVHDGY